MPSRGLFPELVSPHPKATYRGIRLLSAASPGLENSRAAFLCRLLPSPRLGFPLTDSQNLSTRFYRPRSSNAGLLALPGCSQPLLGGAPHSARHKEGHTGRPWTPFKVRGGGREDEGGTGESSRPGHCPEASSPLSQSLCPNRCKTPGSTKPA